MITEASKFGREPEFASHDDQLREFSKRLRGACKDAWQLMDALGHHADDQTKLAILHSTDFATAAYSVRSALILTKSLEGL